MATHSSTLAWKIPWMEETGRLQSMGWQRVRHYRATSLVHWNFQGVFHMALVVKNPPANAEDALKKEMLTHSIILAWKIPWMEERGRLQSRGRKESDTTERLHFSVSPSDEFLAPLDFWVF